MQPRHSRVVLTASQQQDRYDNFDDDPEFGDDVKVQTINEAPAQPAFPQTYGTSDQHQAPEVKIRMLQPPLTVAQVEDDLLDWGSWELDRQNVEMQQVIGSGQYGEVCNVLSDGGAVLMMTEGLGRATPWFWRT